MKATANPDPENPHPPLARDQFGNLLELPDGTCAWRVCRHTGGRPRAVVAPDGQPLRLPLDITSDSLAEMCGADTYRVYAIDEFGNLLGHVTTVEAGIEKASEPELPMFRNAGPPSASSDLRFALEAVAHMARTNSDAMRAIAESQADWIKAIAAAKGPPRNVALPPPQLPPPDDEEDDDEEEEPEPPKKGGVDAFLEAVSPYVPSMMSAWSVKGKKNEAAASKGHSAAHFARIRKVLTPKERDYLDVLLVDKEAGDAIADELARKSVEDAAAWLRQGINGKVSRSASMAPTNFMNDPQVVQKVKAVSLLLAPDERARLMRLAPRMMTSPDAFDVVEKLLPLSDDAAAEWLRSHLAEIESRFAS